MKRIEVVAKTVEGAIEKGLAELGLKREQADIQILSEGGFLKNCKVAVSQKKRVADKAAEFIEGLLEKMKVTCVVEAEEFEDEIRLELIGTDTSGIIGYRGEVLDALQYLVSIAINKDNENYKRIVIDTEDYRAKRVSALEQLAKNLEQKVIRTGRPAKLEPMNSFERRIIHSTLQNSEEVRTASEGTTPNRFVIIYPKKERSGNSRTAFRPRSTEEREKDRNALKEEEKSDGKEKNGAGAKNGYNFVYRSDKKKRR